MGKSNSVAAKAAVTKSIAAVAAKAAVTTTKWSPGKGQNESKGPHADSPSSKKIADGKKTSHNIKPLVNTYGTPYGWAFENFYNAKDFVKDLSNRNDAVIYFGGAEFKPYTNLTTRWVKSSLVGVNLWVIHIDESKVETDGSFPMEAHIAYANKIARAMIKDNTFEGERVDVVVLNLSDSQEADLDSYYCTESFDEARESIFQESIKESSAEMESLI
jgi:hypothetical protein